MPTETMFMGKPISYWLDIEKSYQKIEPILELPEVKRIILENELAELLSKRNLLDFHIELIKGRLDG